VLLVLQIDNTMPSSLATDPFRQRATRSSNRLAGRSGPLIRPEIARDVEVVHVEEGTSDGSTVVSTPTTSASMGGEMNVHGSRSQNTTATTSAAAADRTNMEVVNENIATGITCTVCQRRFETSRGLGQHMRQAHPAEHNAGVNVERVKARWSEEEIALLVQAEVSIVQTGNVTNINQQLHERFPQRTVEAIKGRRKMTAYRTAVSVGVENSRRRLSLEAERRSSGVGVDNIGVGDELRFALSEASQSLIGEHRWGAQALKEAVDAYLGGDMHESHLQLWLQRAVPTRPRRSSNNPGVTEEARPPNSRERRRRHYAAVQTLWKKNRSRAAKSILTPPEESSAAPSVEAMNETWQGILGDHGHQVDCEIASATTELSEMWQPTTVSEVKASELKTKTSPGADNITVRTWKTIPPFIRCIFYNLIMLRGAAPNFLIKGRTIFICKKAGGSTLPTDFRPITVASVVIRQFHKVLAKRLSVMHKWDERQRAFLPMDGCAENLTVLSTLIQTARTMLKELHLATLDISKAFDSVPYQAVYNAIIRLGAPNQLVSYLAGLYANNETILQFGGHETDCKVNRGVRQGDPLSPLLFNLIIEQALLNLNVEVGFSIGDVKCSGLAYADDVILVASTKMGLEDNIGRFGSHLASNGLAFNLAKCGVVSLVPSGRQKRIKMLTDPTIQYQGTYIPQVGVLDMWKYLGVSFEGVKACLGGKSIIDDIEKVSRAPLKPQQRLEILREFVIPKYQHAWVLGRFDRKHFKIIDVKVRAVVRKWLRLPNDVPLGFFHANIKDGGLGIPALQYAVPLWKIGRLRSLQRSTCPVSRAAADSQNVRQQTDRLLRVLIGLTPDTSKTGLATYWKNRLHDSVDGKELRDVCHTTASSNWLRSSSHVLSGADYVHAVHVRINCLPSRSRTSRGRVTADGTLCRGGCGRVETTYHTIQECFRTHGGRVLRHNKLVDVLACSLASKGWTVLKEPHMRTSVGLRKPDLICKKGNEIKVIDAQVVSGSSLDAAHTNKTNKYRDISGFDDAVRRLLSDDSDHVVDHMPLTISWRGIWSKVSAAKLLAIGVTRSTMDTLTRYTIFGSFMNFRRFNKTTMLHRR
jgi:hypothetical protein